MAKKKRKPRQRWVGRTPDGVYTHSVTRYLKEWDAIKKPLMKALRLRCIGFDPDFLMGDADSFYSPSVTIPLWLARRIGERFQSNGEAK